MRSEIPQIDVITAIADAESEDYVAQLLFSQGWNIIFRAFDGHSLATFLQSRDPQLRTVVIYRSNLEGFASVPIALLRSEYVTFISLDSAKGSAHAIMTHIRQELRIPTGLSKVGGTVPSTHLEKVNPPQRSSSTYIRRSRKVIAVTGSAGAPGRTRFSIAISQEISRSESVLVVDADMRSQALARQRDLYMTKALTIAPLDVKQRPTMLPHGEETVVVDLGTLPTVSETVTDRRWQGSLVNHVLDSASHLVYLTKSTKSSIDELAIFLREFPVLLTSVPITYICILSGNSRTLREWEGKFMTLTSGESRFILRESQLDSVPVEPRGGGASSLPIIGQLLKPAQPHRKEIGKILASMV